MKRILTTLFVCLMPSLSLAANVLATKMKVYDEGKFMGRAGSMTFTGDGVTVTTPVPGNMLVTITGGSGGAGINESNYLALSTNTTQVMHSSPTIHSMPTMRRIALGSGSRPLEIHQSASLSDALICFSNVVVGSTDTCVGMRYSGGQNRFVWDVQGVEAMNLHTNPASLGSSAGIGAIAIGTSVARARLEISTRGGQTAELLKISTNDANGYSVLAHFTSTGIKFNVPIVDEAGRRFS
ncbi:MAG TPA: hypothetical protein VEF04_05500, partial [Blastocatellia bacterium]|nr:hypothetical protein [Blastocatellia bacterium]